MRPEGFKDDFTLEELEVVKRWFDQLVRIAVQDKDNCDDLGIYSNLEDHARLVVHGKELNKLRKYIKKEKDKCAQTDAAASSPRHPRK